MNQSNLFPVKIIHKEPNPGRGKDLQEIGYDEPGRRYAIKANNEQHPYLALTEWLCYNLASILGIPQPNFAIIELPEGALAFGSQWDGTLVGLDTGAASFKMDQLLDLSKIDVSNIAALDFFLPNPDRNLGNYLFRIEQRSTRCYSIDWSRCFPFDGFPPNEKEPTVANFLVMYKRNLINLKSFKETLARLKKISSEQVAQILDAAPASWKDKGREEKLVKWWGEERDNRLVKIENFVDGL